METYTIHRATIIKWFQIVAGGLILLAAFWGFVSALITHSDSVKAYDRLYDMCIIDSYESGNDSKREELYAYCRAKARLGEE